MNEPDPLSEALRSVRLTGAIFLDAELGMPWGFASPPASTTSPLLAPTAEHLVLFHLLVEGQATARVPGYDSVPLEAGDIVVLARGDAHELWNGSVSELTDASLLLPKILGGAIASERGGGSGPIRKFICGYIGCERHAQRCWLLLVSACANTPSASPRRWPVPLRAALLRCQNRWPRHSFRQS